MADMYISGMIVNKCCPGTAAGRTGMFPDVSENHWAYEAVKSLEEQGVLEGYPDGIFGGERSRNRYEFTEAVYRVLQNGVW